MSAEAEKIVIDLIDEGVEPDAEFVADAGRDYGYVEAWKYGDKYVIRYGDNANTYYDFTDADSIRDLAAWLEFDLDSKWETIIQTANVRGADAVPAASEDDDGPFWVLVSHDYYGPVSSHDLIYDDDGDVAEFASYAEAQAWIEAQKAEIYITAPNEVGRPSYKIVKATY